MNTLRGIRGKSLRDSRRRALTTALRAMDISLTVRDV